MSAWWAVTGSLVGVVLGATLQYASQVLTHNRRRREAIADRLRSERLEAYSALLTSAHECAHHLAATALHDYGPAADDEARTKAAYFFDLEFVPRFRVVSLVGTTEASEAAVDMYGHLDRFRDFTTTGHERVRYRSREYNEVYEPFRAARNKFTEIARAELIGGV